MSTSTPPTASNATDRYAPPLAPPAPPPPPTERRSGPSRAAAFFLSLFAVGSGQFYLGRTRRAFAWLAIAALGPIVVGLLVPPLTRAGLGALALPFVALVATARFLSAIDASSVSPGAQRPRGLAVAGAVAASLSLVTMGTFVTRVFAIEAFKIPAGSMVPTLLVGDHVFVDKTTKRFRRGHVMVFQFPEHPEQDFVKRVVATEGDRVEMRDGHPWINGWEVPHCRVGRWMFSDAASLAQSDGDIFVEYLEGEAYLTFLDANAPFPASSEGPWFVKAGEAFMFGDNRANSHDSRRWFGGEGGGVPAELARGEPVVIWLSSSDSGVDLSRLGATFTTPTLPSGASTLRSELDRCLASRPARDATVPPLGSSMR